MATNYMRTLMDKPGEFQGSPGYAFALQQGQQAIGRRAAAGGMRGSGNVLAALTQHAVGTAQQDYGNEFNRRLAADTMSGDQEAAAGRLALDDRLGTGRLGIDRDRLALDDRTQTGRLALERDDLGLRGRVADQTYGLGAGRLALDSGRMDNDHEQAWWNYDVGRRRIDADAADSANRFTLGRDSADRGWYDSGTQRGAARSTDYYRGYEAFGKPNYSSPGVPSRFGRR